MITENDLQTLSNRGISPQVLNTQLDRFATGFPFLTLVSSATPGLGIMALDDNLEQKAIARWQQYLADGGDVCKFVPASGAASRMFKALFAFVNGDAEVPAEGSDVAKLIDHIAQAPFARQLDRVLTKLHGKSAAELIADKRYKDVIAGIVNPEGLNYGGLPKGLLSFHRYADGSVRTPLEEQMAEGAQTAATNGKVKLHFTVSHNHHKLFTEKINEVTPAMSAKYGVDYDISLSEQKPSTDTVAANPDNTPFRDSEGNLVFRPGGHGALIENLGDIDSTVVFIKNIDNVVPDSQRQSTIRYKQVIAGVLIQAHDDIAAYTAQLKAGNYDNIDAAVKFAHEVLCIACSGVDEIPDANKAAWLLAKFDRPLRVCGMVRNEGEPGGGPYITMNADGTASPQILESTQIDMSKPENVALMKSATHFNPVDLVCYLKDIEGNKYDLSKYVDPSTGFISEKSYEGRTLKALELPGLWNGAMSDWNTIFVEVPLSTFNPVKTVNDLLRPVHGNI